MPTRAQPGQTTDDSWDKVQKAGKLLVGTSADYAPFESYNDQYQIDGFDIALINEIAKQLGVTVELNDFAFDGLGGAVQHRPDRYGHQRDFGHARTAGRVRFQQRLLRHHRCGPGESR